MDAAEGPTIFSTMSASKVPWDPVPALETNAFAHAATEGLATSRADGAGSQTLVSGAYALPARGASLSKVPATFQPSLIAANAQQGTHGTAYPAAMSTAALSAAPSNANASGVENVTAVERTDRGVEAVRPPDTPEKISDVLLRGAETFSLQGKHDGAQDHFGNAPEPAVDVHPARRTEDSAGRTAPVQKRSIDDIGAHTSPESPTKRPRITHDANVSGRSHVGAHATNTVESSEDSNGILNTMSSARHRELSGSSEVNTKKMNDRSVDEQGSDLTLDPDARQASSPNLNVEAVDGSGANYSWVGPTEETARHVQNSPQVVADKITNTPRSHLDASGSGSATHDERSLSESSKAQTGDDQQKAETGVSGDYEQRTETGVSLSQYVGFNDVKTADSRDEMQVDSVDTKDTATLDGSEVDRSPESPAFAASAHVTELAKEDVLHHSLHLETSPSQDHASEVDSSPDSAGSACTNSPTDAFSGGADSGVSTAQRNGRSGTDADEQPQSPASQEEIRVWPTGSSEPKRSCEDATAAGDTLVDFSSATPPTVVTTVSRPLSLGVALRSAPVDAPLAGDSSDGQTLEESKNSDVASDEQTKPSPPKKPRKRVQWVEDENLAEIHFIDTRLQLIQNWDPESEITLPFAPSTLAQLRAQAKSHEFDANDSERPSPPSGTPGAVGPPLRSAPSENEFEVARRREREMELERSRQAKQQLQAKLDAMVPKCDWRSPFVVILPSECRRDLDNLSDDPSNEDRNLSLPWMIGRSAVNAQPSPASPPPNNSLEPDVPPVEILVTDASATSRQTASSSESYGKTGGNENAVRPPSNNEHYDPNSYQSFHSNAASIGSRAPQREAFRGRSNAIPMQSQSVAQFGGSQGPSRPMTSMPPQHLMNSPMLGNVSHGQAMPPSGIPGLMIHPQALQQLLAQMRQGGHIHGMPGMLPPGPPPFHPPGMMPQLPMQPLGMGMAPPPMMGMPAPPPPHMVNLQHRQQQNQQSGQQQNMSSNRSRKVCRYFNSKQGCRDGPNCAFLHIVPNSGVNNNSNGW
jgi:hypothetical protein